MKKAVVDVGSNSVLLLVGELQRDRWVPVFESSRVTALGEGTKQTGLLSPEGTNRTLDALALAWQEAQAHGAYDIRAAATMAARIARDTPEFLLRAANQGTPVEVLSGEREAELGLRAVVEDSIADGCERVSIIDPGGHSTELVTADRSEKGWQVRLRRSFAIGTLGLRGGSLASERVDGMSLMRASQEVDDAVGLCYRPFEAGRAVVLGAAGTNLVSIRDKLTSWQPSQVHGASLDYEEVSKAAGWLGAMSDAERAKIVGLEPGRERTIHIGALILERFLFALRTGGCLVSIRGWRHAWLSEG